MEKESKYSPVKYIAENKIVEKLIKDYMVESQFKDDLTQEVYMILIDHNQKKLQEIIDKKQIRFYIARIVCNQYFSNTSKFFRLYKRSILLKDSFQNVLNKEDGDEDESFD